MTLDPVSQRNVLRGIVENQVELKDIKERNITSINDRVSGITETLRKVSYKFVEGEHHKDLKDFFKAISGYFKVHALNLFGSNGRRFADRSLRVVDIFNLKNERIELINRKEELTREVIQIYGEMLTKIEELQEIIKKEEERTNEPEISSNQTYFEIGRASCRERVCMFV